jgi:redox-sensitive bicupin YhaK (pirin superfamily)
VEFNNDDEEINITASEKATIIFCHGKPLNEPVVSYGPFVMNTQGEIKQAMVDYQSGKFQ